MSGAKAPGKKKTVHRLTYGGPLDRGWSRRCNTFNENAACVPIEYEIDPVFAEHCEETDRSRLIDLVKPSKYVTIFYHSHPSEKYSPERSEPATNAGPLPSTSSAPEGCRRSRRARGLDADRIPPLGVVKKSANLETPLNKKPNKSTENKEKLSVAGKAIKGGDRQTLKEGKKKGDSQKSTNNSTVTDKHVATASASSDCMCPSSSGTGTTSIYSGTISKGSSDSRRSRARIKAGMIKKCVWLATRRRRRNHSSRSHDRQELRIPAHASDTEMVTGHKPMEAEPSTSTKHVEGWRRSRLDRSQDGHSPVSAANPDNVNVPNPARARSSRCKTSESKHLEDTSTEQLMQKGASSLLEKSSDSGKPLKSRAARSLDRKLLAVTPDNDIDDSNRDSRYSDHNNSSRKKTTAAENHGHMEDANAPSTSTSGSYVRGKCNRTQNPVQMSAPAAQEEESGEVIVDMSKLRSLLDTVVDKTDGFTVDRLQHLYSELSYIIHTHRYQLDKTQLLQEIEAATENARKALAEEKARMESERMSSK